MNISLSIDYQEFDLISACKRGERWAQKQLYEEYYSKMMATCMRYANSEHEALDLLHEGFIKVFKNIGKYKAGTSLNAWIKRIMINNCIDTYRKNVRRRTESIEEAYSITSDDVDAVSQCTEQEILAAIQQLPTSYKTVFNLYAIEGYSHKEISKMLGISESTSRSNLVKARTRLRTLIAARYSNNGR